MDTKGAKTILYRIATSVISTFGLPPDRFDDVYIFDRYEFDDDDSICETLPAKRFGFLVDRKKDIVYGSGGNEDGILGTGNEEDIRDEWKIIKNLSGRRIVDIAAGIDHVLALTADGKVLSWGVNSNGQLGIGNMDGSHIPQVVPLDPTIKIKSISACWSDSFAFSKDLRVYFWGQNIEGEDELTSPVLFDLDGIDSLKELPKSRDPTFLFDSANRLYAYGSNAAGQCGCDSKELEVKQPTLIALPQNRSIKQLICAQFICALLTEDNQLYVWGGFKEHLSKPTPIDVNKAIESVFSFGRQIAVVFHDKSVVIYRSHFSHEEPLACTVEELDKRLLECHDWSFEVKGLRKVLAKPSFGDASDMFNQEEHANIKYRFNTMVNGQNQSKILYAHTCLLASRSPVFKAEFGENWNAAKKKRLDLELDIDDVTYETYYAFLFYMYSRKVETGPLDIYKLVQLYDLGEKYMEAFLKQEAEKDLIIKLNKIDSYEELVPAYELASGHKYIKQRIGDRILSLIEISNCLEISQLAYRNKDASLFIDAASFIKDEGRTLSGSMNIDEYDPLFARALFKAILNA